MTMRKCFQIDNTTLILYILLHVAVFYYMSTRVITDISTRNDTG